MNYLQELSKRIPMEGTINTRDLGGYCGYEGRTIKYGKIIRTDNLSRITEKDIAYFQNVLKASYDIDLRSASEIKGKADLPIPGCEFVHCPITSDLLNTTNCHPHEEFIVDHPNVKGIINYIFTISEDGDVTQPMEKSYREFVASSFGVSHYRQFFHVLLSLNEGSVLFHCADGKDRAGIAAALILLALGVSKEDVIYDYLKTNEYTNQKALNREDYLRNEAKITNEKVIQSVKMLAGVKENWLLAALDEIDKTYQGIDNYLHHQMELSDDDLQKLRDKFLD